MCHTTTFLIEEFEKKEAVNHKNPIRLIIINNDSTSLSFYMIRTKISDLRKHLNLPDVLPAWYEYPVSDAPKLPLLAMVEH